MYNQSVSLQLAARDMRFVESPRGIETGIRLYAEGRRPCSGLLCRSGRFLIAIGERLLRAGMPQPLPRQELARGT